MAAERRTRWVVVGVCSLVYLAVALWFWRSQLVPGDATSRIANAYYTLYSRDPHLAAIGFVWNPLPSLMLLPFLPLKALIPALTQQSLLAVLVSAAFMTGVVALTWDVLSSVALLPRVLLTLTMAAHPMIVLYAGNGMSEACFLFCLLLAVRALQRWLVLGRVELLVPVGLAIGLAYGARYEALAPAAAVPLLVGVVTWARTTGTRSYRLASARADAVIAAFPALVAVAVWAAASKLIVGQWFATFSSEYGNSAQVSSNMWVISSFTGSSWLSRLSYGGQQLLGLSPFVLVLLVAALVLAWRRRDPGVLAPVVVLGSVLAFDALAFLTGTSFGWLRFHITVIPLAVLLAGACLSSSLSPRRPPAGVLPGSASPGARLRRWGLAAIPIVLVTAALPSGVATLATHRLAREEYEWITADGAARTTGLARVNATVAADLDRLALPEGAVVTDAAYAFGVILASDNPRQFIITSDRDFKATLADPGGSGARYLLISALGAADAVRLASSTPADTPGNRTWRDPAGNLQWTLVPL